MTKEGLLFPSISTLGQTHPAPMLLLFLFLATFVSPKFPKTGRSFHRITMPPSPRFKFNITIHILFPPPIYIEIIKLSLPSPNCTWICRTEKWDVALTAPLYWIVELNFIIFWQTLIILHLFYNNTPTNIFVI